MTQENEVIFEIRNGLGLITLNRPAVLNALNLNMIRLMNERLDQWARDPSIHAVAVTGAGGRAFCSGGDVKTVALEAKAAREGRGDGALADHFFYEEYTLNNRIFSFSKPYIALVDGIVMGGGKGISAHGSHRVVTENTLFAMPETSIGFFPDVGGGYFLPRCPGQTGVYLALTSKRIKAVDTVYIGFATHFIPAQKIPQAVEALSSVSWPQAGAPKEKISAVLDQFATVPPGSSELAPQRERIDNIFSHERVEDIVEALRYDPDSWAAETLRAIESMSPTSLKVSLRQIRQGANMKFNEVMSMEYLLSQAFVKSHDFYEGIRAALIDKDKQPHWQPASLAEVDEKAVDRFFQRTDGRALIL